MDSNSTSYPFLLFLPLSCRHSHRSCHFTPPLVSVSPVSNPSSRRRGMAGWPRSATHPTVFPASFSAPTAPATQILQLQRKRASGPETLLTSETPAISARVICGELRSLSRSGVPILGRQHTVVLNKAPIASIPRSALGERFPRTTPTLLFGARGGEPPETGERRNVPI